MCVDVSDSGGREKVKSGGIGANIYNRVITGLYGPKTDTGKVPVELGWGTDLTASGRKTSVSPRLIQKS